MSIDRTRFIRAWADGYPEAEIAEKFEMTRGGVRNLRRELGLTPRCGKYSKPKAAGAGAAEKAPLPTLPDHPFWTPERDALVFRTGGRYRAVAELVPVIGKPVPAILQRWHKLRVA